MTRQPYRRKRRPVAANEWLAALDVDGPFLAVPVVLDAWPAGLPALERDAVGRLRDASALLDASPGTRDGFVRHVLVEFLGWQDNLVAGPNVPDTWTTRVPEQHAEVRPDFALLDADPGAPLLLGLVTAPGTRAGTRPGGQGVWNASAATRLEHALRAQRVPLGLVTDGTEWALVCAPKGSVAATVLFTRHSWLDEPETLKAFSALLGRLRFFGVPDNETLPALVRRSLERQEEITERLSQQSQAVVEMLVATIGRIDADHADRHGTPLLPKGVEPAEVYQASVTVLMRLVFLLYAEERGLLPLDDDTYAATYAASTLAGQLRDRANEEGEATLEKSTAAWHRILATSRALHRGARHDQLSLPAYGGSLFDPDRFPWLEGRADKSVSAVGTDVFPVDDRTLLRALEELQWLRFDGRGGSERRRLSFRTLDVEQIGYVYEGLLDQDALRADDWILGIAADARGQKAGPKVKLSELERQLRRGADEFAHWLSDLTKTHSGKRSPASIARALAPPSGDDAVESERAVRGACDGDEDAVCRILPYAGILRRDPRDLPVIYRPGSLYLTDSPLRADSGAIYTPRTLAEEVVEKALAPLVYSPGPLDSENPETWKLLPPEAILRLKIIDIAAGSGAFLVAATRYLADRLLDHRRRHDPAGEDAPPVDEERETIDARRLVLDRCIYGIDINPMALEMTRLSLWLVTLDRQRPFGFLDDRLAVGDSLLGLTSTEQLLYLHLDPQRGQQLSVGALPSWTADTTGLLIQAADLHRQIADIEVIDRHDSEQKARLLDQAQLVTHRLSVIADALSGASLAGGDDYRYLDIARLVNLTGGIDRPAADRAWEDLAELGQFALTDQHGEVRCPAHFPLLFPEVFSGDNSGFDAVVGNPPYLGGQKITGALGVPYREHLVRDVGNGVRGSADLVAYMFLTAASLCDHAHGQFGLIATNTVAQGDTRQVGLDQVVAGGHEISASVKSEKWPTQGANLEYSIVWASGRPRSAGVRAVADGIRVDGITPTLDPVSRVRGHAQPLEANMGMAFQGSNVLGLGFTMSADQAAELIHRNPRNADVLFPYINGADLNSRPDSSGSRWIINFGDWSEEKAKLYPDCYTIVEECVRPQRLQVKRPARRERWWQYADKAVALYSAIADMDRVLVIANTSKVVQPVFVPGRQVLDKQLTVFATDDAALLSVLASCVHYWWMILHGSTLETRRRYTPSDVFKTLPLPTLNERMRSAGESLHRARSEFMVTRKIGITETYNRVHDPTNTEAQVASLRALHVEIDAAVCAVYGWNDLAIVHDHFETRQGVRWTIPPAARVELLDRLLELNLLRYAEEQARPVSNRGRRRRPAATGESEMASLFLDRRAD